jgi:hypothetical protein
MNVALENLWIYEIRFCFKIRQNFKVYVLVLPNVLTSRQHLMCLLVSN